MMTHDNVVLHNMTPIQLEQMLQKLVREEFEKVNRELQRVVGEDDLISSGTAARLLGVCAKVFRILVKDGHFTVYYHLKEKRFSRGEILNYRNEFRILRRFEG